MTDDFARAFAKNPTRQLPAKRYELFISALEKETIAAQRRIEWMRGLERPYTAVREVLEEARLEQELSLHLLPLSVHVRMIARPLDRYELIKPVLTRIGEELVRLRLREEPEPAACFGGYHRQLQHIWRWGEGSERASVSFDIDLPENGIADLEVCCRVTKSESRDYSVTLYSVTPRADPACTNCVAGPQDTLSLAKLNDAPTRQLPSYDDMRTFLASYIKPKA